VLQSALLTNKILSWVAVIGGVVVGALGLAFLERRWGDTESLSGWSFLSAAALFGFIPLFASLIATRDRRRAGFLFLSSTPFALATLFLSDIDRLRYGMVRWYDLLGYSFLATLVAFVVPGLFWIGTHRLNWVPVMSRPESTSLQRRVFGLAATAILLLGLVLISSVVLAVLIPGFFGVDCTKRAHISSLGYPGQVVVVARVVRTVGPCEQFSDRRMCGGAVAVVQERFWGTRSRIVLLTQGFFEVGEQYLIDGVHADRPLTRFLPIIGFRPCNHSARLKDAEADLRILRDRSPRSGVRIIGSVTRYDGKEREADPGRNVVIAGPLGTVTITTDKQGIYDLTGLPPGRYEVHAATRSSQSWRNQCGSGAYELKSGDVGGCAMDIE
jgi:hypothetical protein